MVQYYEAQEYLVLASFAPARKYYIHPCAGYGWYTVVPVPQAALPGTGLQSGRFGKSAAAA